MLLAMHPASVIPWDMIGFYSLGVFGANLALFLLFMGRKEKPISIGQCVSRKLAGLVIGIAMCWVWIGGQFWVLEMFSDQIPAKLTELGPIHIDAISSVGAGFALQWFFWQPRVVNRYFEKLKK